jgi:hypothetical protein
MNASRVSDWALRKVTDAISNEINKEDLIGKFVRSLYN